MSALGEKIVVLADEMFSMYGLKSVSIDDLCRRMGISKKTFYECFVTKEDLVAAVLEHKSLEVTKQLSLIMGKGNAIDELLAFLGMHRLWASSMQEKSPVLFYDLQKYYPSLWAKSAEQKEQRAREFFTLNIQRGIDEGLYRPEIDFDMFCVCFGFHNTLRLFEAASNSLNGRKVTHQQVAVFIMELLARYVTTPLGWEYISKYGTRSKKS